ncbi:MAG: hypothetical protein RLN87_14810 [Parasphingopyxis sp.]|uniref:hypothetical protein n=1 Tax=Parasphingopyxis sp. TaxID=1920299 RepID=UPI0032EE788E
MFRKAIVIAGAATGVIFAAPGSALQTANDVADGGDGMEVNASNEVRCRRYPPPTGTRIGARNVCKTEAQWAQHDREVRLTMENDRLRNRFGNEGVGNGCGALNRGC